MGKMKIFKGWFWHDLQWRYYYANKYKLQLFWRLRKVTYCNFDMVEAVADFVFGIYQHFFETCQKSLEPWLEEGIMHERKYFTFPPDSDQPSTGIKFEELKNIYDYIKIYRVENKKKVDDIVDYIMEPFSIDWIPDEENKDYVKMDVIQDVRKIKVESYFDELGIIWLKTKEVDKYDSSFHHLENELFKKDSEFLQKIINIRGYLWD